MPQQMSVNARRPFKGKPRWRRAAIHSRSMPKRPARHRLPQASALPHRQSSRLSRGCRNCIPRERQATRISCIPSPLPNSHSTEKPRSRRCVAKMTRVRKSTLRNTSRVLDEITYRITKDEPRCQGQLSSKRDDGRGWLSNTARRPSAKRIFAFYDSLTKELNALRLNDALSSGNVCREK